MSNKKILLFIIISLFAFTGTTQESKETLLIKRINERPYPKWFKDAKLGIFIHWGVYSVPSYSDAESYAEWFLRGLGTDDTTRINFLKRTYGHNTTYKDLAKYFKAELFNPDEWAELFKNAGAGYVVLVSKHHDGYALWPSKYSRNWNSMDIGPKRDLVGELTSAVKKSGLKMGLYYSLSEWNHPLHRWYTDPPENIGNYVDSYMIPQFKELLSTYKPSLLFADGEWLNTAEQWHAAELINWYHNLIGDEAIVNNRWGHGIDVGFLTPEYSAGIKVTDRPWAEVRGLGRSFGLNRNEKLEAYTSSKELIHRFVQTVSNGGGMILNVGPKADGQIPLLQQERLLSLGNWLKINGEAIYGATPYKITEEEKEVQVHRIDDNIDFNWVRNSPLKGIKEDNFSAEWNGFIAAPVSGKYSIELKADDAAAIYIDGKMIADHNYSSKTATDTEINAATGIIDLKAGKTYPVTIKYKEIKQNASISLRWSTKGQPLEVIPDTAFFIDKDRTKKGIEGTYSSKKTYLCYTENKGNIYAISFEWPEKELVLNIDQPPAATAVKLLGLDRELPWTYRNGKMYINTGSVKYSEMPSHEAWTFKLSK